MFGLSLISLRIASWLLFNLKSTLLCTTLNLLTLILLNGIVTVILFFSIYIACLPYFETIFGTPRPDLSLILSCRKIDASDSLIGMLEPLKKPISS